MIYGCLSSKWLNRHAKSQALCIQLPMQSVEQLGPPISAVYWPRCLALVAFSTMLECSLGFGGLMFAPESMNIIVM